MKTKYLLLLVASLTLFCVMACNKNNDTNHTCIVVYTIDSHEGRTTVKNDMEWDQLLNRFCDYAHEGKSVTFYNLSSHPSDLYASKGTTQNNEPTTYTTRDREAMKAWMRRMEQSGKTVNVTYDRTTGIWSGRAYATASIESDTNSCYSGVITTISLTGLAASPLSGVSVLALQINTDTTFILMRNNQLFLEEEVNEYTIGDTATLCGEVHMIEDLADSPILVLDITTNDAATIIGTWQYSSLTEYADGDGISYLNVTTQYIPEEDGYSIYYHFRADGSATRTTNAPSSSTANGTWSLSDDGILCCNLLDMGGGCWHIVWLTSTSMIISRTDMDSNNRNVVYQMLLESTGKRLF